MSPANNSIKGNSTDPKSVSPNGNVKGDVKPNNANPSNYSSDPKSNPKPVKEDKSNIAPPKGNNYQPNTNPKPVAPADNSPKGDVNEDPIKNYEPSFETPRNNPKPSNNETPAPRNDSRPSNNYQQPSKPSQQNPSSRPRSSENKRDRSNWSSPSQASKPQSSPSRPSASGSSLHSNDSNGGRKSR